MNCKQGQLVRYVGTNPHNRPNVYGWIGKVIARSGFVDVPGWIVDPPLPGGHIVDPLSRNRYLAHSVADRVLKPLDNPGDDEVDEISVRRVIPEGEIA